LSCIDDRRALPPTTSQHKGKPTRFDGASNERMARPTDWLDRAILRRRCALLLLRVLPAFLLLIAPCSRAAAQAAPPPPAPRSDNPQDRSSSSAQARMLSSYEGQNVSSIDIAGRPDLDASKFAAAFAQKAGQPFAKQSVDQTAAALKAAGNFQSVRVQVDPEAAGIRVLFILEPAVYFGIFQFPGAGRYSYSRLIQVSNYPIQTPFNATTVEQDRQLLIGFFREQGFFTVEVKPEINVDAPHAIANVQFHVALGRKATFGLVNIEGVSPEEKPELEKRLTTLLARMRGAAIRRGKPYRRAALNRATGYLQSQLQKEGMLGAQVRLAGAEYHADSNSADIHFTINPGPKTQVQIEGARLFPWTKKSLLPIYQGVGVDEEAVLEGQQALTTYFLSKGYFDVKVDSQMKGNDSEQTVIYNVAKQKKNKVTDVRVTGQAQLKASQLAPVITVKKKSLFSRGQFSDQLVRASVNNLKAVYEAQGFSSVEVAPSITRHGGDVQVQFKVIEGPRDIVNSLTVEGTRTFPQSQFAPKGLKVATGQPYSQANVVADRAEIMANYLRAGYLNANFRETASNVSKDDPHHINVVYRIFEGPKVSTGDLITLGRGQTKQRLIDADISALAPGKPLTATDLLTAGSRLYDHTGVFDWAEVDPKRQITRQTKEDVLIKVHEAKRNEFTYGIGFEVIKRGGSIPGGTIAFPGLPPVGLPPNYTTNEVTFWGPRGSVLYTHNNLHGKGESISLTGFAGRLDQRAAIYYIDPSFRWSSWKTTTSASYEKNEENPIYSSRQALASLQVQRFVDSTKHDAVFFRYSFSKTDLTRIEIPELIPTEDEHVRLSTLAANFTRDTRDNPLDEHKGVLQSLEIDFNPTALGSSVNFARLNSQAAYYKEAFHHVVWAGSVRIGLAQPFLDSRVPTSERFFAGGGNSLRGYPLDGAGPQRTVPICSTGSSSSCVCPSADCSLIQVPAGGNELFIINAEARIPIPFKKGLSIVPFYDGGNVFPEVGFRDFTKLYSNNVGLGLRYSTPIGPVRIDVGQNLNPVPGIKPTQYFISIGQAF
jgi:outer membrane protein insertion porin family